MTVQILHGDCRQLMAEMPAGQFDACMADPTYGDTSLTWDKIVDGWLPAVARVLKPTCSIWVFGSMRSLVRVFQEMDELGFKYSQDIVWEKQNGTGFHDDRFRRVHEHAVLFYRGAWGEVYHQTQYTNDATAKTVRRKTRPAHTGHIDAGHYVSEDGGPRMMRSVIYARNEHGRAIHPTQKPLQLLAPLIRYSVPPGGSFVVPFCGSGSDLMVAQAEGMHAVACELDEGYVGAARERLAMDAPLFQAA